MAKLFARIKASQLKTPALKAAYLQALDTLEAGKGEQHLAKQLKIAWYEKNRYFANRIAQTELHRAYTDQLAADLMAEPKLQYVQIRLSQKHPKTDICDLHTKQDKYGLGAGVYPKALVPKPPFHPFCRCLTAPRYDLLNERVRENPNAERAYLRTLPLSDAAQVIGSRAKLQRLLDGEPLDGILNEGKDSLYHLKRLGEFAQDKFNSVALSVDGKRTTDNKSTMLKKLPTGLKEQDYLDSFFTAANAPVKAILFGKPTIIDKQLFQDGRGELKITKRGREQYVLYFADTIYQPDMIFEAEEDYRAKKGETLLKRRFLKTYTDNNGAEFYSVVSFVWREDKQAFVGATAFVPFNGKGEADFAYFEKQKIGKQIK